MSAQPQRFSLDEYRALELHTGVKHEFYHGHVYAMTGASVRHNQVVANLIGTLYPQFRNRTCNIYPNDLRIKVLATGLLTYPAVVIACDPLQFDPTLFATLTNPVVLIEVVSPSTEDYDRGKKFLNYRTIPELQEYVLISPTEIRVEHYVRKATNQWLLIEYRHLETTLELQAVGCSITLTDIYHKMPIESSYETAIPDSSDTD